MTSSYVVCPDCEGHGSDRTQAFHFTSADLDEWYGPPGDPDREQFVENYKEGLYDQPCPTCRGLRVLTTGQKADWDSQERWRAEMAQEAFHERGM